MVHFHFYDRPEGHADYWVVVEEAEVDLCRKDPGHPVDLTVKTDVRTMTAIWRGDERFGEALRHRELKLEGPTRLRRSFPEWLGLSLFASVEAPA